MEDRPTTLLMSEIFREMSNQPQILSASSSLQSNNINEMIQVFQEKRKVQNHRLETQSSKHRSIIQNAIRASTYGEQTQQQCTCQRHQHEEMFICPLHGLTVRKKKFRLNQGPATIIRKNAKPIVIMRKYA